MNQSPIPHTPLKQMEVDSILFRHYKMDHWPTRLEVKEEIARLVRRGRGNLDHIDATLAAKLQIQWEEEVEEDVSPPYPCD